MIAGEERDEVPNKDVLVALSSVFSLFSELDRCEPPWLEPFSGTVICCVGGTCPCTEAGLSP